MKDCFESAGKAAWSDFMPPESLSKLSAPERWRDSIYSRTADNVVLVVEAEGRIAGFAVIRPSGDEDAARGTGEVDAFYTLPRFWGAGGGQALMSSILEHLRKARFESATLWTEERNARPRKFYELSGWRTDGERREREVHGAKIAEVRYRREL